MLASLCPPYEDLRARHWTALVGGAAFCVVVFVGAAGGGQSSSEDDAFFERQVRPLLVAHCFECHVGDTPEGGLRLDNRASLLLGGDRGPAVLPGDAERSLLIRAVSYESDELAMPPDGKLNDAQLDVLRQWVRRRAPWPSETQPTKPAEPSASARQHWSFQPVRKVSLPQVRDASWPRNEIDLFILASLEQAGLTPSPPAESDVLVRRMSLDMLGIPPRDINPDRDVDKYIEQLLSRPEYGERWARHWFDVARYADTKGYVDGGQARFAFAYTYRDYVIRAWNDDLPFDQFVLDQLAADQRNYASGEQWRLAAMGFLTVGRRFNHNMHDILDDQIDVIGRGLQGLTVACARCHDHKFDPISSADYYSLYGILASSYEPQHDALPITDARANALDQAAYEAELAVRADAYDTAVRELHAKIEAELRKFAADYLVYVVCESPRHRSGGQNPLKTERTILRGPTAYGYGAIRRWRDYIASRPSDDPVFGLWHCLDQVAPEQFAERLAQAVTHESLNPRLRQVVERDAPRGMVELAECYGRLLESIDQRWRQTCQAEPDLQGFADAADEELRRVLYGDGSPAVMTQLESVDCYHLDEHTAMRNLAGKVESWSLETKDALPRAMILRERPVPVDPVVFRRGQADRPGEAVPRQIPLAFSAAAADGVERHRPTGSDRLDLARAIVARENPLTARVFVNRVWSWHFGRPLVETPSDFGVRGSTPSHADLLDFLASWFMDHDWSVKQLHRLMLRSRTYQQSSRARGDCLEIDPQNVLYWRFSPRRLDWEAIRDSLLAVAGRLESGGGGRPIEQAPDDPDAVCRSVYLIVDRQHVPDILRNFDVPSPDMTSPGRVATTVPQQQLFFLNSPFVWKQADALGKTAMRLDGDVVQRFRWLQRRILARDVPCDEQDVHQQLAKLAAAVENPESILWTLVAHGMLQSNAFVMME